MEDPLRNNIGGKFWAGASKTRVWTQLIQHRIAKLWIMARKFRVGFSKRVASLRISLIRQKKRSGNFALGVERGVGGDRVSGSAHSGDDCEGALVCDGLADGSAVVGLVGDGGERWAAR